MTLSLFLRLSSVISGSWDFLLRFQLLLFLVIFVFSPLQERHWVFLKVLPSDFFVLYLGHFTFFPPLPLPKRYGPVTAQSSVFHYSCGIPLNTTFTNCFKSQTGYPTCTSTLTCPKLTITLTLVTVRSDFPVSGITKSPGHPRRSLQGCTGLQPAFSWKLLSHQKAAGFSPFSFWTWISHVSLLLRVTATFLITRPHYPQPRLLPTASYQSLPVLPCPIQPKQQGWAGTLKLKSNLAFICQKISGLQLPPE